MSYGSNSFVGRVTEPLKMRTETARHGRHAEAARVRTADRGVGKGAAAYDQVHSPAGQNRNGAVASAVPSALTRGPAHFDWHWRERPALALLAWEA
jgi:hypothetical protein